MTASLAASSNKVLFAEHDWRDVSVCAGDRRGNLEHSRGQCQTSVSLSQVSALDTGHSLLH